MLSWSAVVCAVATHACMALAASAASTCNESFAHVFAAFSPSANFATQPWSVILGGQENTILHSYSAVVAGSGNFVLGPYSVILGGAGNTAAGTSAVVVASNHSRAIGASATVLAGDYSTANGVGTLAVGPNAAAVHDSSGVLNFYRRKQPRRGWTGATAAASPQCVSAGEGTLSICVGEKEEEEEEEEDGDAANANNASTMPPTNSSSSAGSSVWAAAAALGSVFINNVSLGDLVAQLVGDAVNVRACVRACVTLLCNVLYAFGRTCVSCVRACVQQPGV
jgi:hypothetical protein